MKKLLLAAVLFACCVGFALPQQRPTLGVLSFYGSSVEEGDAIATLFGMQPVLTQNFVVLPRTADALEAIFAEHDFQLEGLTDSDTIAGIGRALGAQYVLSGSVRRLGAVNLLVATIINVESFEQVAGYFRTFHTLAEIQGFLDPISRSLVNDMNRRRGVVIPNSLAIVPFAHRPGVDPHDAYTLTQILTLELLNTGYYAILPRTTAINMAIAEFDFQMDGHVADEEMAALGRAINAEYVLSGTISSIGGENMFIASILRVADGSLVVGASRNYRLIGDGVTLMREVARLLTDEEARTEEARRLYQEARRIADARAAEEIALAEARAAEERRQAEIRARQEEAERARQERIARREERREARRERM
ncbi:MAG: hypothetical protein FWB99_10940, partial [Treponema sp.]|nr:hypothetical protein [Treponema sp.]